MSTAAARDELRRLGWDDSWEAARRVVDEDGVLIAARIASEHRGAYRAISAGGAVAWAELTGRAFREAADKRALPTVGDWVIVDRWAAAAGGNGAAVIRAILPRRSLLVRRAAGEATAPQPLASNVDVGLVLTSANGDLSAARLDRYLGLLRDGGIAPVLVLSKVDLVDDAAAELARATLATVGGADVPVIALSVVTGVGVAAIRALAAEGHTAVLLGSSGVGKSSLLNTLLGADAQLTRPIREDERGRHTTTGRELFVTADGGLWIDTPGMRELAQWIDDGAAETVAFDDVTALAATCKFRDCKHRDEPGCAVRAAVTASTLPAARLASFHKLADERKGGVARQSAAVRIAETRRGKAKKPVPSSDE